MDGQTDRDTSNKIHILYAYAMLTKNTRLSYVKDINLITTYRARRLQDIIIIVRPIARSPSNES